MPKLKTLRHQRMLPVFLLAFVCFAQSKAPATVHIYRERLSVRQAAHPTITCDGFPVARLQNGRVYSLKASAGRHAFAIDEDTIGIDVDVESGKEYFVRIDYPPNTLGGRAVAVLVAPDQGRMEIQKVRPLDKWLIQSATCGKP
jgi:hypothetical protein